MLHAHDLVDADEAGQRTGHAHRQHGHLPGVDPGVGRRRLVGADSADLVAPARMPDERPDQNAADRRPHRGEVQRRGRDLDSQPA